MVESASVSSVQMSPFASGIMKQKYAHDRGEKGKENWEDIAARVAKHVMKAVGAPRKMVNDIAKLIEERKFMPGGRYLYAAGRPMHQVQNCLLLRAEDSREGWSDLMHKATMALMTGAGIGVVYSDVRA
jgi:ribonucleoside-diphosphate reductase alpha chain